MKYDATLRDEYRVLFQSCRVDPARDAEVERAITSIIRGGKRYQQVTDKTGVPWFVIGCLHLMECSCNFNLHLHNGDPLCRRTKDVPAGRPTGPWPIPGVSADQLWTLSAIDAIALAGFDKWRDWSAPGVLYCFERYNGFGYRSHGIDSPYLWAASNHYTRGKYDADGEWAPTEVSKQLGAGVVLRRMVDSGFVEVA